MGGGNFLGGGLGEPEKVKMNMEEVIFHEQKLSNILEVSFNHVCLF